jgi:hypothetical protein
VLIPAAPSFSRSGRQDDSSPAFLDFLSTVSFLRPPGLLCTLGWQFPTVAALLLLSPWLLGAASLLVAVSSRSAISIPVRWRGPVYFCIGCVLDFLYVPVASAAITVFNRDSVRVPGKVRR